MFVCLFVCYVQEALYGTRVAENGFRVGVHLNYKVMKKILFIAAILSVTSIGVAEAASPIRNADFVTITLADQDPVPAEVIREFESRFVFDSDGYLRGAKIDMLQPYLTDAEIISLVNTYIAGQSVLYEGYKPKGPRGCRQNRRWLCVIRDVDVIH